MDVFVSPDEALLALAVIAVLTVIVMMMVARRARRKRRHEPATPLEEAEEVRRLLAHLADDVRKFREHVVDGSVEARQSLTELVADFHDRLEAVNVAVAEVEQRVARTEQLVPDNTLNVVKVDFQYSADEGADCWEQAHHRALWLGKKGYEFGLVIDRDAADVYYRFADAAHAADFHRMFGGRLES